MNPRMVAAYFPHLTGNSEPIGIPYNDGSGIELGIAVGAQTQAMGAVNSLGGLKTTADGSVVSRSGPLIPGLFAAGTCAAAVPQDSKGYASGMTLASGSLFGRIAGCSAAVSRDGSGASMPADEQQHDAQHDDPRG